MNFADSPDKADIRSCMINELASLSVMNGAPHTDSRLIGGRQDGRGIRSWILKLGATWVSHENQIS